MKPDYKPPFLYFNTHIETIVPALLRRVNGVVYERIRINTPDDDFLDLDLSGNNNHRLVIISHGLEGNTYRPYITGMVRAFNDHHFDALAWNFRGCSGQMNRQKRFYHSGATYDLHTVIQYVVANFPEYHEINLIGFSLGGNLTLKYLGENQFPIPNQVKKAVVFSVPMDLHNSSLRMLKGYNRIYTLRFLRSLKEKVRIKAAELPGEISTEHLKRIRTLWDFDDFYTGPIHGFLDAEDYYKQNNSLQFLKSIRKPTLIVNARNDTFLSQSSYPSHLGNDVITMEFPYRGGHCGFTLSGRHFWSEKRAINFMLNQ